VVVLNLTRASTEITAVFFTSFNILASYISRLKRALMNVRNWGLAPALVWQSSNKKIPDFPREKPPLYGIFHFLIVVT
jgi:hypothetical protein